MCQIKGQLQRGRLTRFPVRRAEGLFPKPRRGPDVYGNDNLVSSSKRGVVG